MHARGGLLSRERWARRGRTAHAGQAHSRERKMTNKVESSTIAAFAMGMVTTSSSTSMWNLIITTQVQLGESVWAPPVALVATSCTGSSRSGSLPVEARVAPDPVTVAMGYYIERVVVLRGLGRGATK
jgi:hypothetical protein